MFNESDIGKLLQVSLTADFVSKLNKKLQSVQEYNQMAQQMGLPPLNMGQVDNPIANVTEAMGVPGPTPATPPQQFGAPPSFPGVETGRMPTPTPDISSILAGLRR